MKTTFKISGMTCNGCRSTVENKLSSLNGINNVQVDLIKGEAIVYSKNPISFSLISNSLPSKYKVISKRDAKDNEIIKSSKIKQLKPLFIILGYISVTSILLNFRNWNSTNAMLDFMGLFYIIFSFFKILDIKGFSSSFKMYDPLAKKITTYGYIYPFIEILLGLMFLTRIEVNIALLITIIILGITSVGVTQTLLNKKTINCACLGTTLKLPMTEATFIENAIMIVMAIVLLT
ncbi:heavy-metal-associated domain-containing protein [Flavobacteriaceae bacterium]|nr:heavy-metal-associated domain-containing protein [Flavobacteriaceae bacterium]